MSEEELVMGGAGGAWSWLVVPIRTCWWWDRGIVGGWVTSVMGINLRGRKRECYRARGREQM